jgi:hypothetical protein
VRRAFAKIGGESITAGFGLIVLRGIFAGCARGAMVLIRRIRLGIRGVLLQIFATPMSDHDVVLDAFSRRALGWSMGPSLQAALPLAAMNRPSP